MKKIQVLKNAAWEATPTIKITSNDPGWKEAHESWKKGHNPTSSPEWKKGVYMSYEDVKEDTKFTSDQ